MSGECRKFCDLILRLPVEPYGGGIEVSRTTTGDYILRMFLPGPMKTVKQVSRVLSASEAAQVAKALTEREVS